MGIIPLRGRTIEVLSKEEIQAVHQTVLELLKDPGVKIKHEEALDIFKRGGADVDLEKNVVHIPPSLVEYALNHAPRFMKVCGRDPKYDLKSNNGVHYSGGHGATMIFDFDTGERRPATKKKIWKIMSESMTRWRTRILSFPKFIPRMFPKKRLTGIFRKPCSATRKNR
jgi:trimethylamine--corrinoid protein Co-methyltransferase